MKSTSRRLLAVALASVLFTGCGVGDVLDSGDSGADPTVAEPSDDPAGLEGALPIGDTFEGDASTTVEEVIRDAGDDTWVPAGDELRVALGHRAHLRLGRRVEDRGGLVPVGRHRRRRRLVPRRPRLRRATGPAGQYPRLVDLAPGECAEGRILIPVPIDAELVTLVNASQSGVTQGTWLVGDVGVPAVADDE